MTFDLAFEIEILAQCLRDSDYLKTASRLLDAHHFVSPELSWVWGVIKNTWAKYAERATVGILAAKAEHDFPDGDDQKLHLELVLKLFKTRPETPRATLGELERFVRFVSLQVALEGGAKELERGNIDKAWDEVRKATLRDLRPKAYKMSKWMEEFEQRQAARKHKAENPDEYICVPTGLPRLDSIVTGLQAGELGLIMGTTKVGKSIMLNHLGYHAILRGYGVAHFSLEMSVERVAARYDSRFTMLAHRKFKHYDFTAEDFQVIDARLAKMREKLNGKLRIVSMPSRSCSINTLKHALEEIRSEIEVQLIIVDSGDHMQSLINYGSKRLEQTEVYLDLKSWTEEEELPIWSSTHAGREWAGKRATAEAAAESYDKSRIADLVATLNEPSNRSRATRVSTEDMEDDPEAGPAGRSGLELY
ncbi:hypothetical protein LCGC14_1233780, partial [marine sediment metagenome]